MMVFRKEEGRGRRERIWKWKIMEEVKELVYLGFKFTRDNGVKERDGVKKM